MLRAQLDSESGAVRLYATAILGYTGKPADISLLLAMEQQTGQSALADVARRSIDLINSFSRPAGGFTEFAVI